jgi:DNA adenine methylase
MIKPPYPYFGGKMAARDLIWQRIGYTPNRVDPFFGGGSFLWIDPGFDWQAGDWRDDRPRIETANDIDGFIANFWRAVQCDPAAVAEHADRPVNENDLHAIHSWLINNPPDTARLEADPDYYDAKIAGWWVWGVRAWIVDGDSLGCRSASPCAAFGLTGARPVMVWLTKVPAPMRDSSNPSEISRLTASSAVVRDTPTSLARVRVAGRRSPPFNPPDRMMSRSPI